MHLSLAERWGGPPVGADQAEAWIGAASVGASLTIGSIRGIDVRVHPTFALLFLWVIYQWGIATSAGAAGIIFGTLVLLLVFACVLAHELAHAWVAHRYGLAVHDITLLPIGGVARVEYTALRPREEAWIAAAGPAMNLAIAVALTPLVLLVAAIRHIDQPLAVVLYADEVSVAGFVLYLWITNILLALFNLLPAFPMDGGRILRAGFSALCDRVVATKVAVVVGQLLAIVLVISGIWLGDYLLPLVALFILISAQLEARWVQVEATMRALPVGQFALWEGGGIRPEAPLAHALRGGPKDIAVTQDGVVVGMLWRHELLPLLSSGYQELLVKDLMDRSFNPVEATDSVYDVYLWLSSSTRPAVPVVERGVYRGIFTSERLAHVHQHVNRKTIRLQYGVVLSFLARLRAVAR